MVMGRRFEPEAAQGYILQAAHPAPPVLTSPTSCPPPLWKQARTAQQEPRPGIHHRIHLAEEEPKVSMAAKYIVGSLVGSCVIAYACDYIVSQKKIFGGTIPGTVSDKEWWQATDKKFQAWPRTAGPPVVMNPISRQNFIVKDL
uniref:Uncharacterized protein n=1 Tax=Avena sativa TaxID=4498 RepID=A0ACD6ABK3_AVESA